MRTWREVRNFASQKFRLIPEPELLFNLGSSRSLPGHFLNKNMGKFVVGWMTTGVWTGVGFSDLKNFPTRTLNRIKKFRNRSGVGVWTSDSDPL